MKLSFSARQLFFARLLFDLGLCTWQILLVKAAERAPDTPFYANPMVILAITNPAVTLLSTTIFSDATLAREWIWVPLYLVVDAAIWGGLWIIIHWLRQPTNYK
ncbi:MAG: hypothetical protein FJW36_01930 [Acidobacteria bacterium]|nr:hypothetical protein [Acidobacteriota bacterium]